MTKKRSQNAEANSYFEAQLGKLHDASFSTLMAGSHIKDARTTCLLNAIEEALRMENIAELKMRLATALSTDNVLEGTLRLKGAADLERFNLLLDYGKKIRRKPVLEVEPRPAPPQVDPPHAVEPMPDLGPILSATELKVLGWLNRRDGEQYALYGECQSAEVDRLLALGLAWRAPAIDGQDIEQSPISLTPTGETLLRNALQHNGAEQQQ